MKILVTGGAGFIGSYVSRALVRRGDDVVGIDNFQDYYPRVCKEFNLDLVNLSANRPIQFSKEEEVMPVYEKLSQYYPQSDSKIGSFVFEEADIVDFEQLQQLFEKHKPDAIIHLAAMAGVPLSAKKPRLYTQVNVDGSVNMLELSKEYGIKQFVFASTASAYGQKDHKVKEEEGVSYPWSIYGATKSAVEAITHAFYKIFGLNVAIARIFGPIYGPLQRPYGMLIQRVINYVHNDKTITVYGIKGLETAKDFTYIDDEVNGILLCLDKNTGYNAYNIGTSDAIPIKKWFDAVGEAMGKPVKYEIVDADPGDVATSADITKAKTVLGYEPKMDYKEGVRRQAEVFSLMPDWYKKMENV
ncbi:MAG TPA: GDP-mannose 4,6-dehydratase [Patescibacteria group bacterium]